MQTLSIGIVVGCLNSTGNGISIGIGIGYFPSGRRMEIKQQLPQSDRCLMVLHMSHSETLTV